MGIAGTEVSKEAADIVLLNDSFATIVKAVRWGRGLYENFKRFICFQLTANVSSVGIVLVAVLMGFKAPFTALQLLWINIIMDGPPALTLGLEPAKDDLMKRPPVKRTENILTTPLIIRVALTGFYISAVVLLQNMFNFLGVDDSQMSTVSFGLLSLFLLFNAFNCRELGTGSIFPSFMKNKPMLLVTAITMVLQVFVIQYAGAFFSTVPLPLEIWLKLFGMAISVVVLSELVKLFIRIARTLKS
jgi:Ca2+-transporting ATPase